MPYKTSRQHFVDSIYGTSITACDRQTSRRPTQISFTFINKQTLLEVERKNKISTY